MSTVTTENMLKQTPLHEEHLALKARMVDFGGWDMPVQYEGILAEYEQTRNRAAIFDISHMGEFIVEGDCVESGLDRIVTMTLADLPVQSSRYGAMLNEQGGVIDDLIVFRLEKNKWFIVVNGATTQKDAEHIQKHLTSKAVFKDISSDIGKVDIQGPLSRDVLKTLAEGVEKLNYFTFDFFELLGEHVLISRTGYTGELGYEIFFPWERTKELWQALLKNDKVKPVGLGARDVLRLEMGYSLYGHELNEETPPLESGLKRFVDMEKDFIGKTALLQMQEKGFKKKIVGLASSNRRSPRAEQKIYSTTNEEIGVVTSGTFSPSLNKGIGLGFVDLEHAAQGTNVFIGNGKGQMEAAITKTTFYKNGSLKN